LDKRGIAYTRQQGIVAKYEEAVLDVGFRGDIIMEGKLVVEINLPEAGRDKVGYIGKF